MKNNPRPVIIQLLKTIPKHTGIKIIRLYQKILSPDHGVLRANHPFGYCRFQPTCSEYAIIAISKYGLIKGGARSMWRILRCNPLGGGGWDPVK